MEDIQLLENNVSLLFLYNFNKKLLLISPESIYFRLANKIIQNITLCIFLCRKHVFLDSVKYFILLYFYTTTFDVAFSSAGACNSKPLVFEHMSMQLQTSCFLTHEHTTPNLLFFNTWTCNSKPLFSQVAQVVFLSETFPKPRRYLQDAL